MTQETQPTPFQMRVYETISRIPKGKVSTYGWVAKTIGCRSAQAVGQALRRNPYAPRVPCHRVIAADLTIGGFSGERSGSECERKRRILAEEGVLFDETGYLCDPGLVFRF